MTSRLAAFLTALLLATPGLALEGDFITSYSSGEWMVMEYLVCDFDYVDASPPNPCATFDTHTGTFTRSAAAGGATVPFAQHTGLPQFVVYDVRLDNGGAPNNNIGFAEGLSALAGQRHQLHATGLELGTTTSSVTINPLSHRFLGYSVTTEGVGTDMEVVIRLFYPRAP